MEIRDLAFGIHQLIRTYLGESPSDAQKQALLNAIQEIINYYELQDKQPPAPVSGVSTAVEVLTTKAVRLRKLIKCEADETKRYHFQEDLQTIESALSLLKK